MKLDLLAHNIHGPNNPVSIWKERLFLNALVPKPNIVMILEHKLKGSNLDNLGTRLMPRSKN